MLVSKKQKTRRNNKSKGKKQRTFTSSEMSFPEDRQNMSLSQLFRNDLLKRKTQPKPTKSQKQLVSTKKRTKSRGKLKLDKCETYEVIPYKNSLNSEIVFSNQETKRERPLEDTMNEQLAIRVNQQYKIDSNRQLRISIKKEYQKKTEAAVKIQKVFRGYLTRKILQKYVQKEHITLSQKLGHQRSESVSEHSSYFTDKENESRRRVLTQKQGVFEYSRQQDNEEELSSEEEEINTAIYRHHDPIYLHAEDSQNLYSDEEEDFNQQTYFPIMELAAQYLDSRKSSGQQSEPRNKLSRPEQPEIDAIEEIAEEPPLTPNNPPQRPSQELNLSKTEKKGEKQRRKTSLNQGEIREQTVKLNEDEVPNDIPQFLETIEKATSLKSKESLPRSEQDKTEDLEAATNLERLKEDQMVKWSEIIELVQLQITKSADSNEDLNNCMQKIMQMSIKNKQNLQLSPSLLNHHSQSQFYRDKSIPKMDSRGKLKIIKADRQYLSQHQQYAQETKEVKPSEDCFQTIGKTAEEEEEKHIDGLQPQRKKDNITLTDKTFFFDTVQEKKDEEEKGSDVPASLHSPISSFETTGQMKKFLSGNIQEDHIQQMLKIRGDSIKKKQLQEMRKLNIDLENRTITQEQFMSRIENMTTKFSKEKQCVEKTKEDISKGYQAAMKLTKEAVKDAKQLGYRIPISRSLEGIKYKNPIILDDIIIDELFQIKKDNGRKVEISNKQGQQSDQESSDLQFTEEELKRFRRAQPYDIELAEEIADMGRNVMISAELFRQQQLQDEDQNMFMKTQHVLREVFQIESPPPQKNIRVDNLTEKVLEWIFYEIAGEIAIKPLFSEKLIDKNHFFKPQPVSDKERIKFIELLEQHFPKIQELNHKLNQKICPLPTELLKCMRIDFSEEEEDENSYEEIGKYEFIIGQEICNDAIQDFLKQVEKETPTAHPSMQRVHTISEEFDLNDRVVKYVEQREKYISNRKNHTKELRWEVLNIEIHCIFDAWNEELIFLRSQKAGYSGIGLNELTLSIKDHNFKIPQDQTIEIIKKGKNRLMTTLGHSSPALIFPMIVDEEEGQQLQQDSRWIFYADEALSYGLELVYLIEEEVFSQMAKELCKRSLSFLPS